MATVPKAAKARQSLQHGQLGLFGVIMPGVAQVAPAFNLFFTTGLMVSLAGASAPLIFLISMVGMVATASSLAQFASIYPSAGSFITYITRAIGTKVALAVGVITILGYIIAFGGIYIFVGSYIVVIMYLAANAALIVDWARLRRRGVRKNPWLWVVVPVIGIAVLAIPVWGDLRPGQTSPYNTLPWLTIALVAAGIIYALVLARLRPRVLEQAPALLEGGDGEDPATNPLAVSG
jgi:amino acid transporter